MNVKTGDYIVPILFILAGIALVGVGIKGLSKQKLNLPAKEEVPAKENAPASAPASEALKSVAN